MHGGTGGAAVRDGGPGTGGRAQLASRRGGGLYRWWGKGGGECRHKEK